MASPAETIDRNSMNRIYENLPKSKQYPSSLTQGSIESSKSKWTAHTQPMRFNQVISYSNPPTTCGGIDDATYQEDMDLLSLTAEK